MWGTLRHNIAAYVRCATSHTADGLQTMKHAVFAAALVGSLFTALPANATSGWGCYRANVGPSDPLKVREGPSANTPALTSIHWNSSPIVALAAKGPPPDTLFEAHQREFATCTPSNLPLGARWCPVSLFDGDSVITGYVKRRFLDHSECP